MNRLDLNFSYMRKGVGSKTLALSFFLNLFFVLWWFEADSVVLLRFVSYFILFLLWASFLDLCITFVHLWYIFEEALHIFLGFQNAFYVEFKATWVMPLIKLFCAICEYFGCHGHVVYMTLIFILLFALIQWNRL